MSVAKLLESHTNGALSASADNCCVVLSDDTVGSSRRLGSVDDIGCNVTPFPGTSSVEKG